MSIYDEIAADAAEVLNDIGRPVTFRGVTVMAIVGDAMLEEALGLGGFSQSAAVSIKLMRSEYEANPPRDGEKIDHAGVAYRISSVSKLTPSAWYELRVDPINSQK